MAYNADWTIATHADYGYYHVVPTPTPEEITAFYAAEFYSGEYAQLNDSSLEVQDRDHEFYEAQWLDICDRLAEIIGPLEGRTLLDVGCGWAKALRVFRDRGLVCAGFDPAPEAVEYAQGAGLEVVVAGVDRMDVFGTRRFDVVTLLNVLEHLADPVTVVRELRDLVLAPGGVLVIDVPNEFNVFQLAGQTTHQLDRWWLAPPGHLNYFSATTLRRLLEGEGLSVKAMKASFPIEMFLLFGQDYVSDPSVGRRCHEQRMAFESNLRATGNGETLDRFYTCLAQLGLGRQILAFAQAPSAATPT